MKIRAQQALELTKWVKQVEFTRDYKTYKVVSHNMEIIHMIASGQIKSWLRFQFYKFAIAKEKRSHVAILIYESSPGVWEDADPPEDDEVVEITRVGENNEWAPENVQVLWHQLNQELNVKKAQVGRKNKK